MDAIDPKESICRLCCTSDEIPNLNNLFDEKNRHLLKKLNYFACFTFRMDVNDGFPPFICMSCTELLQSAYKFKMICESAEANFWALSQSNITDEIDDECSFNIESIAAKNDDPDYDVEYLDSSMDSHPTELNHGTDDDIESQTFQCDVWGTEETNRMDIVTHMKIHESNPTSSSIRIEKRKICTKVNGPTCYICSEIFSRKRDLKDHLKIVHDLTIGKKSWICESCGKDFRSQYALKYHISGAHVDAVEKNYSCDLCDFKCRRARYLVSHALKHTGAKPHRCEECGLAFGFHGSLNRHIQAVHRHEKRHKCTICDRNFKTKFRLKEHFNSHSGEDPHECPHCPRTYRYKNSLSRHVKKYHKSEAQSLAR